MNQSINQYKHVWHIFAQGPVPRKMVKLNPGLNQKFKLRRFSCLRTCNLSLQNTLEHLLKDTEMMTQNFTLNNT